MDENIHQGNNWSPKDIKNWTDMYINQQDAQISFDYTLFFIRCFGLY